MRVDVAVQRWLQGAFQVVAEQFDHPLTDQPVGPVAGPRYCCRTGPGGRPKIGLRHGPADRPGGVHQPDVAERLREVPEQVAGAGVHLLGQQPDVVDMADRAVEDLRRPLHLPGDRQSVRQPERAEQEAALVAGQPVDPAPGAVPADQTALVGQPFIDRGDRRQHPRVVRRQETHDRQHQVGGVQVGAAEVLPEGLGLVAPALGQNSVVDPVPGVRPAGEPAAVRAEQVRHPGRPVERDPAHHLGVQEVPWFATHLPDPLVRVLPAHRCRIRARGQEPPGVRVQPVELFPQHERGPEQLAVDVHLLLVPGAVADPYRPALPPAAQLRQGAFGQVVLAADPEHHRQCVFGPDRPGCRGGQEVEELDRLVRAGRDPERFHREAGVPHPGVPVVPVPLATDRLGQRGGGGRDDRAGRGVGQPEQHPAAVLDQVGPGTVILLMRLGPGPPAFDRGRQLGRQVGLAPDPGRIAGAAVLQPEQQPISGSKPDLAVGATGRVSVGDRVGGQRHRGGEQQAFGATPSRDPAVQLGQQRPDQPVLGARPVLDLQVHLTIEALDGADQQVRGIQAQGVHVGAAAQ